MTASRMPANISDEHPKSPKPSAIRAMFASVSWAAPLSNVMLAIASPKVKKLKIIARATTTTQALMDIPTPQV